MRITFSADRDKPDIPHWLEVKLKSVQAAASKSPSELVATLDDWDDWEHRELADFNWFAEVFNSIDGLFEEILSTYKSHIALDLGDVDYPSHRILAEDIKIVKSALRFTSLVTTNCINKGLYNSAEHLVSFLGAFDDEIASLALDALAAIGIPPIYHRCHLEWVQHRTSIHKQSKLGSPFFSIIDSARDLRSDQWISIADAMNPEYMPSAASFVVSLDVGTYKTHPVKRPVHPPEDTESFHLVESIEDIIDLSQDHRSIKEILMDPTTRVPQPLRFSFMWRVRMQRWMLSSTTRWIFYNCYFQAVAILLCCFEDAYQLAAFFQDKLDIVNECLYLLRTGPGGDGYDPDFIPISIRLVASQCLQAVLGSEESLDAAVFGRFQALQHSLGLNRGQYIGLMPCLLRSSAAYLVSISEHADTVDSSSKVHEHRLLWIESIMLLTMAVLQNSEINQHISETGLISSLLAILKFPPVKYRSRLWAMLDSAVIMVTEATVAVGSATCAAFLRQDGLTITISRLEQELQMLGLIEVNSSVTVSTTIDLPTTDDSMQPVASSAAEPSLELQSMKDIIGQWLYCEGLVDDNLVPSGQPSVCNGDHIAVSMDIDDPLTNQLECGRIIIQNLLVLLNSIAEKGFVQEAGSGVQIYNISQVFKGPQLSSCIKVMAHYAELITPRVLSSADTLLAELINSDPATPSMINHIIQSGLAESLLKCIDRNVHLLDQFTDCFVIDRVGFIYSLALTKEGCNLIEKINPFPNLFSIFLNPKYQRSDHRMLTVAVVSEVGEHLEEIVRHYPQLQAVVLDAMIIILAKLIVKGLRLMASLNAAHESMNNEYLNLLQGLTSLLQCLQTMFTKETIVTYFLNQGGLDLLSSVFSLTLGPNRYFVANLSSEVWSLTKYIGHHQTIVTLSACLQGLASVKSKDVIAHFTKMISHLLTTDLLHNLCRFWEHSRDSPHQILRDRGDQRAVTKLDNSKLSNVSYVSEVVATKLVQFMDSARFSDSSNQSEAYLGAMRSLISMSYLITLLFPPTNPKSYAQPTALASLSNILMNDDMFSLVEAITRNLVPVIRSEFCSHHSSHLARSIRERNISSGLEVDTTAEVDNRPLFRLLVVSDNGVWVRDGADETSNKLFEYPKGAIIDAFERRFGTDKNSNVSANKMLKYRVQGGWISANRKFSVEPQIEVIDIYSYGAVKSKQLGSGFDMMTSAIITFDSSESLPDLSYDSMTPILATRMGIMAISYVHCSFRYILEGFSKALISIFLPPTFGISTSAQLQPHVMRAIRPLVDNFSIAFEKYDDFAHVVSEESTQMEVDADVADTEKDLFFIAKTVDLLDTLRSALQPTSTTINFCLLINLFYTKGTLESLLKLSQKVFVVCFRLTSRDATDGSSTKLGSHHEHAVECLEIILDLYSRLLNLLISSNPSNIEKVLIKLGNGLYGYESHEFRVQLLLLLDRYSLVTTLSPQMLLSSLPYAAIKHVLDNMQIAIKAAAEVKTLTKSSSVDSSSRSGHRLASFADVTVPQFFNPGFLRGLSPPEPLDNIPRAPLPPSGNVSTPADTFRPSESTISTLCGMGFPRNSVLRGLYALQDNDADRLIDHLTRTTYSSAPLTDEEMSSRVDSNAESGSSTDIANQVSSSSSSSSSSVTPAMSSSSATSSSANPNPSLTTPATAPVVKTNEYSVLFPLINTSPSAAEFQKQIENVKQVEQTLLSTLATMAIYLSELPAVAAAESKGVTLTAEAADDSKLFTRDVMDLVAVNTLLSCLEKQVPIPVKFNMKFVALIWFYERAIAHVEAFCSRDEVDVGKRNESALFGSLHAIILLLYGHIPGSVSSLPTANSLKNPTDQLTIPLLIISRDSRCCILHEKLISALEIAVVESRTSSNIASKEWLTPAILLLDVVAQPIFVDRNGLRDFHIAADGVYPINPISKAPTDPPLIPDPLSPSGNGSGRETWGAWGRKFPASVISVSLPVGQSGDEVNEYMLQLPFTDSVFDYSSLRRLLIAGINLQKCINMDQRSSDNTTWDATSINNSKYAGNDMSFALTQATLQLLVHITRNSNLCADMHSGNMTRVLLQTRYSFPGIGETIFTLLQHQLEDRSQLQQSMATEIKACFLKLKKKRENVLLSRLLEITASILYRDQQLFMAILRKCFLFISFFGEDGRDLRIELNPEFRANIPIEWTSVTKSSSEGTIGVKRNREGEVGSAGFDGQLSGDDRSLSPDGAIATKRPRATTTDSIVADSMGSKAPSSKTPSRSPRRNIQQPSIASGLSTVVTHFSPFAESVINEVMQALMAKYVAAMSFDLATTVSIDAQAVDRLFKESLQIANPNSRNIGSLTISDILYILGDLVATVPGVATCIHRYDINNRSLDNMKPYFVHAMTGASWSPTASNNSLYFVIHCLLLSQFTMPPVTNKLPDNHAKVEGHFKEHLLCRLTGLFVKDAAAYLLGALISRPGEGRKRALSALIDVLKSVDVKAKLSHTKQLKALLITGEVIENLLSPPSRWTSRDIYTIPSLEVLCVLTNLGAHTHLSNAICAINMEHPLALDITSKLSVLLDLFVRKGVDFAVKMHKPVVTAIKQQAGTTGTSTSDCIPSQHAATASPARADSEDIIDGFRPVNTDVMTGGSIALRTETPVTAGNTVNAIAHTTSDVLNNSYASNESNVSNVSNVSRVSHPQVSDIDVDVGPAVSSNFMPPVSSIVSSPARVFRDNQSEAPFFHTGLSMTGTNNNRSTITSKLEGDDSSLDTGIVLDGREQSEQLASADEADGEHGFTSPLGSGTTAQSHLAEASTAASAQASSADCGGDITADIFITTSAGSSGGSGSGGRRDSSRRHTDERNISSDTAAALLTGDPMMENPNHRLRTDTNDSSMMAFEDMLSPADRGLLANSHHEGRNSVEQDEASQILWQDDSSEEDSVDIDQRHGGSHEHVMDDLDDFDDDDGNDEDSEDEDEEEEIHFIDNGGNEGSEEDEGEDDMDEDEEDAQEASENSEDEALDGRNDDFVVAGVTAEYDDDEDDESGRDSDEEDENVDEYGQDADEEEPYGNVDDNDDEESEDGDQDDEDDGDDDDDHYGYLQQRHSTYHTNNSNHSHRNIEDFFEEEGSGNDDDDDEGDGGEGEADDDHGAIEVDDGHDLFDDSWQDILNPTASSQRGTSGRPQPDAERGMNIISGMEVNFIGSDGAAGNDDPTNRAPAFRFQLNFDAPNGNLGDNPMSIVNMLEGATQQFLRMTGLNFGPTGPAIVDRSSSNSGGGNRRGRRSTRADGGIWTSSSGRQSMMDVEEDDEVIDSGSRSHRLVMRSVPVSSAYSGWEDPTTSSHRNGRRDEWTAVSRSSRYASSQSSRRYELVDTYPLSYYLPQELAVRPVANPLLTVIDICRSRENRRSSLSTSAQRRPWSISSSGLASGNSQAGLLMSILNTAPINTPSANTLSERSTPLRSFIRVPRGNTSRRGTGPQYSDRRWGNDVGEIETVGTRLALVIMAVVRSISESLHPKNSTRSDADKASVGKRKERVTGSSSFSVTWDDVYQQLGPLVASGNGLERDSIMAREESKHEGTLQESKEEVMMVGDSDVSAVVREQEDRNPEVAMDTGDHDDDDDDDYDDDDNDDEDNESDKSQGENIGGTMPHEAEEGMDDVGDSNDDSDHDEDDEDDGEEDGNSSGSNSDDERGDDGSGDMNGENNGIESSDDRMDTTGTGNGTDPVQADATSTAAAALMAISDDPVSLGASAPESSSTSLYPCPPGLDPSTWESLPLEMQLEYLRSLGLDTAGLIESEINASSMDRDVLMSLPAELRTEVLAEESNERKRRMSFDNASSGSDLAATTTAAPSNSSSSSSAAPPVITSTSTISNENVEFINSLVQDLRRDVFLSADATFLLSLTPSLQAEARTVRARYGMPPFDDGHGHPLPARASAAANNSNSSSAPTTNSSSRRLQPRTTSSSSAAPEATSESGGPVGLATTTASSGAVSSAGLRRTDSLNSTGSLLGEDAVGSLFRNRMDIINEIFGTGGVLASTTTAGSRRSQSSTAPADSSKSGKAITATEDGLYVELGADRSQSTLIAVNIPPFSSSIAVRMFKSILYVNNGKCPRAIGRMLATICLYNEFRVGIVKALFAGLTNNVHGITEAISSLLLESDIQGMNDLRYIQTHGSERLANPLTLRRLIASITYIMRKTEWRVWADILAPETNSLPGEGQWLLGSLISLLSVTAEDRNECFTSLLSRAMSGNIEYVLHLLEEIMTPFMTLTVSDTTKLAEMNMIESEAKAGRTRSINYQRVGGGLELEVSTSDAIDQSGGNRSSKLRRVDVNAASSAPLGPSAVLAPGLPVARDDTIVPISTTTVTTSANRSTNKLKCLKPFPLLSDRETQILSQFVGSEYAVGSTKKRMHRILRVISLSNINWYNLLRDLSYVGTQLATDTTSELKEILTMLKVIDAQKVPIGSTSTSQVNTLLMLPLFNSSSESAQPTQQRLLSIVETMTLLRSRSHPSASDSGLVASTIRDIAFGRLWTILFECLDLVRDIEGLSTDDMDDDDDTPPPPPVPLTPVHSTISESGGHRSTSRHHVRPSRHAAISANASSSGSGVPTPNNQVGTPSHGNAANASSGNSSHGPTPNSLNRSSNNLQKLDDSRQLSSLSSITMRFIPLIECFMLVCGATILKRPSQPAPQDATASGATAPGSSGSTIAPSATGTDYSSGTGMNPVLPGFRFRQHAAYLDMQMELSNDSYAHLLISFVQKNRLLLNMILKSNVQLLETSFSPLIHVPRCRHYLHFDIKRAFFRTKLKRLKQQAARNRSTSSYSSSSTISVNRNEVFEDSFRHIRFMKPDELKRKLVVEFNGEEGMDAGGLTREWFSVLAKEIFNVNYALFNGTNDNVTFQPNPMSSVNPEHLSYFKFIGRVIGKALFDGHLFDAHFTRSFYKHMLGLPVSMADLEAIEPNYYKSLKQILETPLDLLGLDLTFTAESNQFGKMEAEELLERGGEIAVTDDNKFEYVKLLCHHRMTTAIRQQIDSFLEGFHELIPPELISIFDAQELELLISGLPDIDLEDLRAHTEYFGYKATDPTIQHFWSALRSLSKEEKALFLQFVTGTSKIPLDGFSALQGSDGVRLFNIHKAFGTHLLPAAHTCFNQLDLPEYETEETMREKLLIAIREGSEGFGFA